MIAVLLLIGIYWSGVLDGKMVKDEWKKVAATLFNIFNSVFPLKPAGNLWQSFTEGLRIHLTGF